MGRGNIKYLLLGGAALIVIPLIISKIRKMVKGVRQNMNIMAESFKDRLRQLGKTLKYSLYVIFHPFDGFGT